MWSGAMQVWPLLENFPQTILRAASSISAVESTIVGDLPPSSSVTEVRCFAAAAITILPTCGLPVKKMWSKGRSSSACETRSEEHTSELQSLMRISYAVFCLKKKTKHQHCRERKKQTQCTTQR